MKVTFNTIKPINFSKAKSAKKQTLPLKTDDSVFLEAKKIVTRSLYSKNPKESFVLIDNNRIVYYGLGSADGITFEVDMCDIKNKNKKIALIHSHPRSEFGASSPLSLADCYTLLTMKGLNSITAVNEKGECSTLQKKNGVTYDITKYKEIEKRFNQELNRVINGKNPDEFLLTYKGAQFTHDFWKRYHQELALNYFTDYGSLK